MEKTFSNRTRIQISIYVCVVSFICIHICSHSFKLNIDHYVKCDVNEQRRYYICKDVNIL